MANERITCFNPYLFNYVKVKKNEAKMVSGFTQ